MQLSHTFRELGDWSHFGLEKLLPPEDDPVWDLRQERQRTYAVHSQTRSILFKWLDNAWRPGNPLEVVVHDTGKPSLDAAVNAAAEALTDLYGGVVVKLMLAELPAGGVIAEHRDSGPALALVHRCHLPVVTNAGVEFWIDGLSHQFRTGIAYEIDNTRRHAAANRGTSRRVHLICDVLCGSGSARV